MLFRSYVGKGGWKVEGKFVKKEDGKFFLENDGDVYMVFKDKVSCMLIADDEKNKKQTNVKMQGGYDDARKEQDDRPPGRVYSGLEDGMSGVSLPSDILLDEPSEQSNNNFSVFFPSGSKKINITSEE